MNQLEPLFCGVTGFVVAWVIIRLVLARSIWIGSLAGSRQFHQTHTNPIPRLGGVALATALVTVGALVSIGFENDDTGPSYRRVLLLGSLAMFGLGFLDDLRPVRARFKLAGQILIAATVHYGGLSIEAFRNPFTDTVHELGWWSLPITVFWLVACTNVINLIDGLDGLAGGIGLMVMCLLAFVGLQTAASFSVLLSTGMAGALLGFLFFNFPPARIYMGDGGAYLVGFLIGTLAIISSYKGSVAVALVAPVIALALPIADVGLAILRRGVRGLPIFRPDKKHIHHRLMQFGFSPTAAVLILYSVSLVFLLLGFSLFWTGSRLLPVIAAFALLIAVAGLRSLSYLRDWLFPHGIGEDPVQTRREARYALTLGAWLEMEAERCDSIEALWQDLQFLTQKLRLGWVRLTLADGHRTWAAPGFEAEAAGVRHDRHELGHDSPMIIEFAARPEVMPEKLFYLLSELASEAWLKAARRWQELHPGPLCFDSVHTSSGPSPVPAVKPAPAGSG
jgi:UDP-GlcNAc:undecaprenyl-phosphate GlcNAc-1-phosphate transferase